MTADDPGDTQRIRAWLLDFAAAVRARDYATGRALFAPDARGFGSAVELAEGLDALETRQWRRVWDASRDFDFRAPSLRIEVAGDLAFATALWSSTGLGEAGPFPRAGRATIVLARRPQGWLAVHSHFSLDPEAGCPAP